MERQKDELIQQRELQKKIIGALLFEEGFDTLVNEIAEREAVLADELRTLIDKKWVSVVEQDGGKGPFRTTKFHNADDMREYHYVATRKGLEEFQLWR